MAGDLCTNDDVATLLLRPLTDGEAGPVKGLITQASGLLRNAAPSIDIRMGRWLADPTDKGGVDPAVVATVVAGIVKRYVRNPDGLAAETAGPFSATFALRSEKDPRGVLAVTAEDLATLFPSRKRPRAGTIRTRPALAPRPVGRYGPLPSAQQIVETSIEWSRGAIIDGSEVIETLPYGPDLSTS